MFFSATILPLYMTYALLIFSQKAMFLMSPLTQLLLSKGGEKEGL